MRRVACQGFLIPGFTILAQLLGAILTAALADPQTVEACGWQYEMPESGFFLYWHRWHCPWSP